MSVFGVDYAWGRPGVAALRKAGVKFVARYLSHDTSGKNLDAVEARQLSDAGIWIDVVWESTASRALAGRAAGIADATDAARMAHACGMPSDRPIFFAVDFDATGGQEGAISAYLDGAASVLTRARVGIYGGYSAVAHALNGGHAAWGWQTYAWSGGRWHPKAQLQQYLNDQQINGVDLDYDRAVKDDFGQWRVGVTPANGGLDMTPQQVFDAVWNSDAIVSPGIDPANKTWQASSYLTDIDGKVRDLQAKVAAMTDTLAEIAAAVIPPPAPRPQA